MNLIKSPLNALLNQAGVPTLAGGGTPPTPQQQQQQPMQPTSPSTLSGMLKAMRFTGGSKYSSDPFGYGGSGSYIEVFRHDPKGKHGGKEGLETQSTKLNADQLTAYAKALRDSKFYGGRSLTPEQLMTMALVEGRSDYGYNDVDVNNKRATGLAEKLIALGHPADAAGFAAAVDNKMRTADRLGIPFHTAWNGTGVNPVTKMSGSDYNARINAAHQAGIYEHPKNAQLYEAVQSGFMSDPEQVTMPQVDAMGNPTGMKRGGSVAKEKAFLKFHKK